LMINPPELSRFSYFRTRTVDEIRNSITTDVGKTKLTLMDIRYHEGEFISRENIQTTAALVNLGVHVPSFTLDRENLLDRVGHLAGFQDIDFPEFPEFSRSYALRGEHPEQLRKWFDDLLLTFLEQQHVYHIMGGGKDILIFEKERLATVPEIKGLVSFATALAELKQASQKTL
ncbi:MAG: SulP family inorganic anion transporter, partial [Bacteroidota bacterium]|nr:SulP family inorganic anion transporter [Bacteroidota bacterium]